MRSLTSALAKTLALLGVVMGLTLISHAGPAAALGVADCTTAMSGTTLTVAPGTTTVLEYASCGDGSGSPWLDNSTSASGPWLTQQNFGTASSARTISGTGAWWTRITAALADDGVTQRLYLLFGSTTVSYTVVIQTPASPSAPVSESQGTLPSPWLQSFARLDPEEMCPDGWASGYAEWPHGGTGGWVCNRTTRWSASSGDWVTVPGLG